MFNKLHRIYLIIVISSLNSCLFMFDQNYTGDINTTLAGNVVLEDTSCYIPANLEEEDDSVVALSLVFHLITLGDRYVSVCVSQNNYNLIVGDDDFPLWAENKNLNITFYATNSEVDPASNSVGDASEVLLTGYNQNDVETSLFTISPGTNTDPRYKYSESVTCANKLGDTAYKETVYLTDLNLNILHEKKYIVARAPFCANYAIGIAANPLYSSKNINNTNQGGE